ncbi:MAG TPA: hypothetical protein VFS87_01100 [Qipengyuania sp.]|nr:hypothetical protein [Qipengyuania sp.]
MVRKFASAIALLGMVSAPIAASAVTREAAPVADENGLAGQGTLFFLAGIAVVALAVVFLPEDQPASP